MFGDRYNVFDYPENSSHWTMFSPIDWNLFQNEWSYYYIFRFLFENTFFILIFCCETKNRNKMKKKLGKGIETITNSTNYLVKVNWRETKLSAVNLARRAGFQILAQWSVRNQRKLFNVFVVKSTQNFLWSRSQSVNWHSPHKSK